MCEERVCVCVGHVAPVDVHSIDFTSFTIYANISLRFSFLFQILITSKRKFHFQICAKEFCDNFNSNANHFDALTMSECVFIYRIM